MNLIILPIAGLMVGIFTALAGVGGGIVVVPFLLWWGLPKDVAAATSFFNMVFVVAASLFFYGTKGQVEWKTGLLLGVGSIVGVYLAVTFLQPHINEKFFRYFFAGVLILMAVLVIYAPPSQKSSDVNQKDVAHSTSADFRSLAKTPSVNPESFRK